MTSTGIEPPEGKMSAITKYPAPTNAKQLKYFFNLLNFYGEFLPNLISIIHPFNNLLKANTPYIWPNEKLQGKQTIVGTE